MESETKVIGHRGASRYAPENTLASFKKAADMGAHWIELDVHLSKDGRLVVIHDTTVDRTTDGTGPVWSHTAAGLKGVDAGSWFSRDYAGEGVPTLREVFGLLPLGIGVNVEVKTPGDGDTRSQWELARTLLEDLDGYGVGRGILISSFDLPLLRVLGEIRSDPGLAYLFSSRDTIPEIPRILESVPLRAIHPHHSLVDKELMGFAMSAGLRVNAWTVNDPERMIECVGMGVDGLISDVPDLALGTIS